MKQKLFFIFVLNFLLMISICGQIKKPPLAKAQMETKEYHGVKIDDPYSYMQNFNDEKCSKMGERTCGIWKKLFRRHTQQRIN